MKKFGCLALLVVLGLGGLVFYRALNPPRVGGVAFNQLPPQAQQERRVSAQKLVEQVEEVARAAKEKKSQAFSVVASEDQLNTLLQDRLKTEKFPIRDLRAGLSPGQITLQGTASYQGIEVPATLSGSLQAQNGQLSFRVDSLQLSGLPAPGNFKEKAEKSIGEALQKALNSKSQARIESVEIETGKITVAGQTG